MEETKEITIISPKIREKYSLKVGNDEFLISLFLSMNSWCEYSDAYEKTSDTKLAFMDMLIEKMDIEDENKKVHIRDLLMKDTYDGELLTIMQKLVNNEKYFKEYFEDNHCELSYDSFHKAFEYQNEKVSEQIRILIKPLVSGVSELSKQFGETISKSVKNIAAINLPKIDIPKFNNYHLDKIVEPLITKETTEYFDRYDINPMSMKTIPQIDVIREIERMNEHSKESIDFQSQMLNIMKEEKDANERFRGEERQSRKESERMAVRCFVFTFILSLIGVVVAIMSFIGKETVFSAIEKIYKIVF